MFFPLPRDFLHDLASWISASRLNFSPWISFDFIPKSTFCVAITQTLLSFDNLNSEEGANKFLWSQGSDTMWIFYEHLTPFRSRMGEIRKSIYELLTFSLQKRTQSIVQCRSHIKVRCDNKITKNLLATIYGHCHDGHISLLIESIWISLFQSSCCECVGWKLNWNFFTNLKICFTPLPISLSKNLSLNYLRD